MRRLPSTAFKPGQSGNPAGRPKGCRNKATQTVIALMEGAGEQIVQSVIRAAQAGDLAAAKMVIDRLAPPLRERPVNLPDFPDTNCIAGINRVSQIILESVASGELTPGEAATLSAIVEARRKALETQQLSERIGTLEKILKK
ncbi:DUF5681 domain-containing protein [Dechloromonas sp. H13]|uniref:DUF5681 domain-containing protein n=1 Tax=Dechloromonas sp. H13 TaxID=2570193 RepID=UPI001290A63B|nr:DUF5681 domain-containing protein [Dechloromonas sp. H13]